MQNTEIAALLTDWFTGQGVEMFSFLTSLEGHTDCTEMALIEVRHQWEQAEHDPDKLAELMEWETLRQAIDRLMAGEPLADVIRGEDYTPEQEAAFDTTARLLRDLKEQEASTVAI